jgi:hypothetical protein
VASAGIRGQEGGWGGWFVSRSEERRDGWRSDSGDSCAEGRFTKVAMATCHTAGRTIMLLCFCSDDIQPGMGGLGLKSQIRGPNPTAASRNQSVTGRQHCTWINS